VSRDKQSFPFYFHLEKVNIYILYIFAYFSSQATIFSLTVLVTECLERRLARQPGQYANKMREKKKNIWENIF